MANQPARKIRSRDLCIAIHHMNIGIEGFQNTGNFRSELIHFWFGHTTRGVKAKTTSGSF